jgi:2,3-dihydro-2,3-dihydroxybenzoate dehydrogenase
MDEFADKIALVTGAASGIGAAITRALSERGATVAAVDRDTARLHEILRKITADGREVRPFPSDVTDSAGVGSTVALVEDSLGPLDFLVNAAGVLRCGNAVDLTDED